MVERLSGPPCATDTNFAGGRDESALTGLYTALCITATAHLPTWNSEEPVRYPIFRDRTFLFIEELRRLQSVRSEIGLIPAKGENIPYREAITSTGNIKNFAGTYPLHLNN